MRRPMTGGLLALVVITGVGACAPGPSGTTTHEPSQPASTSTSMAEPTMSETATSGETTSEGPSQGPPDLDSVGGDPSQWLLTPKRWGNIRMGQPVPDEWHDGFSAQWECIGPIYSIGETKMLEIYTEGEGSLEAPVTYMAAWGDSPVKTQQGISVGSPASELQSAVTDLEEREGPWSSEGLEVFEQKDEPHSLFYEVTDGAVEAISVQDSGEFIPVAWSTVCGGP